MSRLQLFRPAVDDVLAGPFNASSHAASDILSFVVEGSKLRSQTQYALARRARILRRNSTCPSCHRSRVIPLSNVDKTNDFDSDAVVHQLSFACEDCGNDWVA